MIPVNLQFVVRNLLMGLVSPVPELNIPRLQLAVIRNNKWQHSRGRSVGLRLNAIARAYLENIQVSPSDLQSDSSPEIQENFLIRSGYQPNLDPAQRWAFFGNYVLPDIGKEAAMNSLNSLITFVENHETEYPNLIFELQLDMNQLRRHTGVR